MNYKEALAVKEKAEKFIFPVPKLPRIFSASGSRPTTDAAVAPPPPRLMQRLKRGIVGAGIAKSDDGNHMVKLFVNNLEEVSKTQISSYFGVEDKQILIDPAKPLQLFLTRTRQRPPFPGISVGHYRGLTGTFGAVVEDKEGNRYILSNNHVLANSNDCEKGDKIIQPGGIDEGQYNQDVIGHLYDYVTVDLKGVNYMDAAIAKLEVNVPSTLIPFCEPIEGVGDPVLDATVRKYGRTTGETEGIITTADVSFQVLFNETPVTFAKLFEVQGHINAKEEREAFSGSGDSGSLIVDTGQKKAVGLLFAGIEDEKTFACPLRPILDALKVSLVCKTV